MIDIRKKGSKSGSPAGKSGKLVRIRRNFRQRGGNLAGVCEGLGRYFDVNPLLFRLGFVASTFFSGLGLLAYLAMAVALPDESGESLLETISERIREERGGRQLPSESPDTEKFFLCENCDTAVKQGSKYCHHCGQPV